MDKNRCKKCNSANTRFRIGTRERVCNHCGYVEKILEQKEESYYNG